MWSLLVNSNNDVWNKLFAYLYDNFLFVADIIWNTKLPLTDISIGYWLIFWLIIRLSIYAVNGASTGFNELVPEVQTSSAKVYKNIALRVSRKNSITKFNTKKNYQHMKNVKYKSKR